MNAGQKEGALEEEQGAKERKSRRMRRKQTQGYLLSFFSPSCHGRSPGSSSFGGLALNSLLTKVFSLFLFPSLPCRDISTPSDGLCEASPVSVTDSSPSSLPVGSTVGGSLSLIFCSECYDSFIHSNVDSYPRSE